MDKRLVELSSRLDGLIEFAGIMSGEAVENIFGKLGARRNWSGALGGTAEEVSSAISKPATMAGSAATGGITGSSPLENLSAARSGIDPGIVKPVPGPMAATGAPAAKTVAAPVSPQDATQVANQAGQNAAAGAQDTQPSAMSKISDWWKQRTSGQKLAAAGGGLLAGGALGGYALAPRQNQQYSEWIDDIIQFDRGAYIAKGKLMTSPELSEKAKKLWAKVASKHGGPMRQQGRDLLAWSQKKNPKFGVKIGGKEFSSKPTPIIFESAEETLEFADPRPRNPLGEFTRNEGGPDPNAMATTYKMPQDQPGGLGLGKAAGAALVGGALGAVGGAAGKAAWEHTTKIVKKLAANKKQVSRIIRP